MQNLKICEYCKNPYDSDRPKYCCDECQRKGKAKKQRDAYKRYGVLNSSFRMLPLNFPARTTCFGWDSEKKACGILLENVCMHRENCPFFKTKSQHERDRKEAELRLKMKSLDY